LDVTDQFVKFNTRKGAVYVNEKSGDVQGQASERGPDGDNERHPSDDLESTTPWIGKSQLSKIKNGKPAQVN
jgi:hypothetical protein